MQVLQLTSIGPLADQLLMGLFRATRLWEQDEAEWLTAHGSKVIAVVTSVRRGCDASLMSALPNLGAICSWGVGFETIDSDEAGRRNIQISNTPDVLDDCVADMAWALMLAAARRVCTGDRYVRDGRWTTLGEFPVSTRVSGKRLGILGLGRIGRAIARRGEGFSMDIRYHGRTAQEVPYLFEPSLADLARWCDFLVVACIGGLTTFHLVSAEVLSALGPNGILVNIARGSVVDQQALIQALDENQLGGAGLDVLESEPGAPLSLRACDRVVLMPHVGSATTETRRAMEQLVIDNLRAFLETGCVLTQV